MSPGQRDQRGDGDQVFPAGTVEPQPVSWLADAATEVKPWSLLNVEPAAQDAEGLVSPKGDLPSVFGPPPSAAKGPEESLDTGDDALASESAEEQLADEPAAEEDPNDSTDMELSEAQVEAEPSADAAESVDAQPGESEDEPQETGVEQVNDGTTDDAADLPAETMQATDAEVTPPAEADAADSEAVDEAELLDDAMPLETGDAPAAGPEPCPLCDQTREEAALERQRLLDELEQPMVDAAGVFQRAAVELSRGLTDNILKLSMELAAAVLNKTAVAGPETLLANLDNALSLVGPVESLTIRCHPEDAEVLRAQDTERLTQATGGMVDATLRDDDTLRRGECVVDFHEGLVDARWGIQIERLATAIGPVLQRHVLEQLATLDEGPSGSDVDNENDEAEGPEVSS